MARRRASCSPAGRGRRWSMYCSMFGGQFQDAQGPQHAGQHIVAGNGELPDAGEREFIGQGISMFLIEFGNGELSLFQEQDFLPLADVAAIIKGWKVFRKCLHQLRRGGSPIRRLGEQEVSQGGVPQIQEALSGGVRHQQDHVPQGRELFGIR